MLGIIDNSEALKENSRILSKAALRNNKNLLVGATYRRRGVQPRIPSIFTANRTTSRKGKAWLLIDKLRQEGKRQDAKFDVNLFDFCNSLDNLVANTHSIYQGDHSLCGPAAFLTLFLHNDPLSFCNYVISLYQNGHGRLGTLEVTPDKDLLKRKYDVRWDVDVAEWIALSSLRDSENIFLDYEGKPSEDVSGITFPGEIRSWMRASQIYNDVIHHEDTSTVIQSLKGDKDDIVMLIDSRMIGANPPVSLPVKFPNHYIILSSSLQVLSGQKGKTVSFDYWSWGSRVWRNGKAVDSHARVLKHTSIPLEKFINTYFSASIGVRK